MLKSQKKTVLKKLNSELIRTIFSVLVTPTLITICAFFIKEMYEDQKQVEDNQNEILVVLSSIKERQKSIEDKITINQSSNNYRFDNQLVRIETCESEIRDLLKIK